MSFEFFTSFVWAPPVATQFSVLSYKTGVSLNVASMQEMWLCALSIFFALAINEASYCTYTCFDMIVRWEYRFF